MMKNTNSKSGQSARILRGRGQVGFRDALCLSFGDAIRSRSAYISTLIWGSAFGLMSAQHAPASVRPLLVTGCLVIAASISFGSMFPWRWRLVPRKWPAYSIFAVNGLLALAMGVVLFFVVITLINVSAEGTSALRPGDMMQVFWYALYGFQFPLVGFYITLGSDFAHRGQIQQKEKERYERIAEQARLIALRSQINPHFFFNALNTIAALIPERPADAERAVELMATALRPVLTRDQAMVATLECELQVARAYAAIEELRLGARCEFLFDISQDALACSMPSLSLQPLLENAVRHGASNVSGQYRIMTRACVERGTLCIVLLNGRAGDAASQEEVAMPVGMPPGHALNNISQRLRLLFGERSKLEVVSVGQHRGRCLLIVPQRLEEPAS